LRIVQHSRKMIGYTVDLKNFPNISSVKDNLESAIAVAIAEDLKSKYQAATDFSGNAWVPKKSPGQLLVDTGATLASLNASGNIIEIAGQMIWHQEGTSRLPARPIIGVSSEQEKIAEEKASEVLESLFN
jgi:hypothetical protein